MLVSSYDLIVYICNAQYSNLYTWAGAQGVDFPVIASAVLDGVAEFAINEKPSSLKRVRLVIFDSEQVNLFKKQLKKKVDAAATGSSAHKWKFKNSSVDLIIFFPH